MAAIAIRPVVVALDTPQPDRIVVSIARKRRWPWFENVQVEQIVLRMRLDYGFGNGFLYVGESHPRDGRPALLIISPDVVSPNTKRASAVRLPGARIPALIRGKRRAASHAGEVTISAPPY